MSTDKAPTEVNEPKRPAEATPATGEELREPDSASPVVRGSRWVDYDTHELLQMISELEDERRWARLREGVWIAILIHLALISAMILLPRYIRMPQVVNRSALNQPKDFTYLDTPKLQPKVTIKPVPTPQPTIDKKTLEEMNKATPAPPVAEPTPKAAEPAALQPAVAAID